MDDLVVVIDADRLERYFIAAALAADGLSVVQSARAVEGITRVMDWEPSLVVIAEDQEPVDLEETLSLLRRVTRSPVIVIGSGDEPDEIRLLSKGGDFYIQRPVSASGLLLRVRALSRRGDPAQEGPAGDGGPATPIRKLRRESNAIDSKLTA